MQHDWSLWLTWHWLFFFLHSRLQSSFRMTSILHSVNSNTLHLTSHRQFANLLSPTQCLERRPDLILVSHILSHYISSIIPSPHDDRNIWLSVLPLYSRRRETPLSPKRNTSRLPAVLLQILWSCSTPTKHIIQSFHYILNKPLIYVCTFFTTIIILENNCYVNNTRISPSDLEEYKLALNTRSLYPQHY